jgi:Xaa-Pro dipeptidase
MRPGHSSRLLSPSYAFVSRNSERALIVSASMAVNAAHLGGIGVHTYGNPGVDLSLQSPSPSPLDQRFLDAFQHGLANSTAIEGLVSALIDDGLAGASIGIELESVPQELTEEIQRRLPKARLRDCTNLIRLIRAVKTREEIGLLASASEIAENAAMSALELARVGGSTQDLVHPFMTRIAQSGACFDHFSFSLHGLGICDNLPRPFQPDDVLFVDYGCLYSSYFSDTGTTLAFNDLNPDLARRYRALHACLAAGVEAMRPGIKASAVQAAMQQALRDHGVTACFPHGHGMGLELRDYPILVPPTGLPIRDDCIEVDSDLTLEPGMVINLETPLFLPTAGALQIEKTYVITENGNRDLCAQDRMQPFVASRSLFSQIAD